MDTIVATLAGEKITSNSQKAFELFESQRFGERNEDKIIYTIYEAHYLLERKKLSIQNLKSQIIPENKLLKQFEKLDKKFGINYAVFKDLRNKGYILKTALKFGAQFRVYEKGKDIGENHAKWILFPVSENQSSTWQDFSSKNRVAHSTNKKLLIGIVDEENEVSYYEINWLKIR